MAGSDDLRWILFPRPNRRGRRQGVVAGEGVGATSPSAAQAAQMMQHQQMVQKNNMMSCAPNSAPAGYPQQYQAQQARASAMYGGYYQNKAHTPPIVDPLSAVRGTMPNALPVHPDVQLKRLPFYDHIAELFKPSTLMAVGSARMQEQSFVFHLTPSQANEIAYNREVTASKSEYTVQVQMRFCLLEVSCEQEDFFPPGIVVKVNGKNCPLPNPIPTNRPGVEPKRPPRPVNISPLVRISPTVSNHINVTWAAEYGRGYVIALNLVRKLTSTQLLHRLKTRGVRHADYTTGLIKEKLRDDADNEIATTSLRVSLMCPLGKMRMSIPCRPTTCTHLQCFDANLYLQMNERKPTWTCPVCDKPGLFDKLVIDGYFQEVLNSAKITPEANEIQLHQDGTWSICLPKKEDKSDEPPPVKSRGGPPVVEATVEIADDDVVPVDEGSDVEDKPKVKASAAEVPKKPNVSTVDLTLSDDDDDDVAPTPIINKTDSNKSAEVSSNTSTAATPGYISPNIITLDSPSPPASPAPPPPTLQPPAPPAATSSAYTPQLPPFFDLDNEASGDYHGF
ncbi:E3 SUMO-protein ligase PIAS3-like isoform X2 [Macrosteles quadrilineatus]|uniref:E3 SUMO-protein ligase PIAS3-like isoform X2 n=1 Tax=Macrosteles quadrilineatus TaxID=74068 RepID=UPI0023E169FF|nr:E3 SUMO-protein ligase PIAS3-like isoform X2 [Macrosteles quadrilineatus]